MFRPDHPGLGAGEESARRFALKHHDTVDIEIALPGAPGENVDFLDLLVDARPEAVRHEIENAEK